MLFLLFGTKSPNYREAKFLPVYAFKDNRVTLVPPRGKNKYPTPWIQSFPTNALPHCVLVHVRNVHLVKSGPRQHKLCKDAVHVLRQLPGSTCHATVDRSPARQLRPRVAVTVARVSTSARMTLRMIDLI